MNKVLIGIKTEEKIIGITTIEEKRISMTEGVGKKHLWKPKTHWEDKSEWTIPLVPSLIQRGKKLHKKTTKPELITNTITNFLH